MKIAKIIKNEESQRYLTEMNDRLKIIPIGGLNEIGKNATIIQYNEKFILIDCGLKFPEEGMFGVDIVIPDMSYVYDNFENCLGLIVTHGHEDHIGGIPYLLSEVDIPIFASKFTAGLIRKKLEEYPNIADAKINLVSPDEKVYLGDFVLDFIRVTHSIPDSLAIVVKTPLGVLLHTGDFKVDYTPVDKQAIDLQKIAKVGSEGV